MINLDIHTHLAPVGAPMAALAGVQWDAQSEKLIIDGHVIGAKDLFHPERLIARMDRHRVARALVSIPPPLYRQGLPADEALAWARCVNRSMLEFVAPWRERLGVLFYLPLEHPDLFETLMSEADPTDYEGVALAAGGHPDIVYSDQRYEPLWHWLNTRNAFVFLHPGTCADPRLAKFYLENLVGNPVETGVAAAHLVMAGVPARFPGIRFALAHAGGIFTALVGRMERGAQTSRPGMDPGVERPLQAARRFWVDDIAHHPATLTLAREIVGPEHVMHGSDWPFPMGHLLE